MVVVLEVMWRGSGGGGGGDGTAQGDSLCSSSAPAPQDRVWHWGSTLIVGHGPRPLMSLLRRRPLRRGERIRTTG